MDHDGTDGLAPAREGPGAGEEDQAGSSRWSFLRNWWGGVFVLAAFACLVITGLMGVNFGYRWDEPIQLGLVNHTITSGSFVPVSFYDYPGVTYLLSLLSVLPWVVHRLHSHATLTGADFYVHGRTVFLLVTSLGGIWLYLALRRRAGELGAAFGGATYLLSFQLAYHARWIAPDAVLAMVTALFLWFLVIAWDAPSSGARVFLPAIAAGLAMATKYQGAVLMIPVLVLFIKRWRTHAAPLSAQVRGLVVASGLFLVTFLVITPGAILRHHAFFKAIEFENQHYRTGHTYFKGTKPYDVHNHLRYLLVSLRYVAVSLPSHIPALSWFVVALGVIGFATLAWREPWLAAALGLPMVVVTIYYSGLVVFFARNLLLFLPFVAFLAGIGVGRLAELAHTKLTFSILAAVLLLVALVNGAWLVTTAESILHESPAELVRSTDRYMRDRPGTRFVVSGPLQEQFRTWGVPLPPNARTSGSGDDYVALFSQIVSGKDVTLRSWPATTEGTYRVIGPQEVDFDFYPTWRYPDPDRVLVMTPSQARRFGLDRRELSIAG